MNHMRVPFAFLFVCLVSPCHQENQNRLAPRLSAPISSVAGAGRCGKICEKFTRYFHPKISKRLFSHTSLLFLCYVICDAHWFSPTFSFGWLWLLCRKGSPVHKFIWERQKEQMKVRCGEKGSSSQAPQKKCVLACCGKYFQSHVYCLYNYMII